MGRWAQARKRGGGGAASAPPCPQPMDPDIEGTYSLGILVSVLITGASEGDDGGSWQMFDAADQPIGPAVPIPTAGPQWADPSIWEATDFVYVIETGNGVNYCGSSNPGTELETTN